jgi:hypothetical protein
MTFLHEILSSADVVWEALHQQYIISDVPIHSLLGYHARESKGYLDTVQVLTKGCILQLIIQNNLTVTASVVSALKEDICLKTQNTPYFRAAVPR